MKRFFSVVGKTGKTIMVDCKKLPLKKGSKMIGFQFNEESKEGYALVQHSNATTFVEHLIKSDETSNPVVFSTTKMSGLFWSGLKNGSNDRAYYIKPEDLEAGTTLKPVSEDEGNTLTPADS